MEARPFPQIVALQEAYMNDIHVLCLLVILDIPSGCVIVIQDLFAPVLDMILVLSWTAYSQSIARFNSFMKCVALHG